MPGGRLVTDCFTGAIAEANCTSVVDVNCFCGTPFVSESYPFLLTTNAPYHTQTKLHNLIGFMHLTVLLF